jgi:hypothetical protein
MSRCISSVFVIIGLSWFEWSEWSERGELDLLSRSGPLTSAIAWLLAAVVKKGWGRFLNTKRA